MKLQVSASTKPSLNSIKHTFGGSVLGKGCSCSLHAGLLPCASTALGSFWKPGAHCLQPVLTLPAPTKDAALALKVRKALLDLH